MFSLTQFLTKAHFSPLCRAERKLVCQQCVLSSVSAVRTGKRVSGAYCQACQRCVLPSVSAVRTAKCVSGAYCQACQRCVLPSVSAVRTAKCVSGAYCQACQRCILSNVSAVRTVKCRDFLSVVAVTMSSLCDAVQRGRNVPVQHALFIFRVGRYICTKLYGVTCPFFLPLSDGDLAVCSCRGVCAWFLLAAAEFGEDVHLVWRLPVVMSISGLNWLRTL
jgi:hypothetical protein